MKTDGTHKYDDIITLPHHVSKKHPRMTMPNRAAQFSGINTAAKRENI